MEIPSLEFNSNTPQIFQEERFLIKTEVSEILKKDAIHKVSPAKYQFLSNVFLVEKKDERNFL